MPGLEMFLNLEDAKEKFDSILNSNQEKTKSHEKDKSEINSIKPKNVGIILIDSFKNIILHKTGSKQVQEEALDIAVENGL